MLLNNLKIDFKVKTLETSKTQDELAKYVGTTPQYLSKLMTHSHEKIVNKFFVGAMEDMGYDIKIEYIPRKEGKK